MMLLLRIKAKLKMRFGLWGLTEDELASLGDIAEIARVWNDLARTGKYTKITLKIGWL